MNTVLKNSTKRRHIRKSIALIVITILITISFTPTITTSPIIRTHENTIDNSKSNTNFKDLKLGDVTDEPISKKLENYFCIVILEGKWSMQNLYCRIFIYFLNILYELFVKYNLHVLAKIIEKIIFPVFEVILGVY